MQTDVTNHKRQDKEQPIMKKYTKLVLMVVAIMSSLCFLIYKYRYDRLYNVLQVMEVFGTPDDPSCVPCVPPPPLQLSPAWQQVSPTVHLYSAYCDREGGSCPTVTVLGVARGEPKDYKCRLWFEGSIQPMEGILSATRDSNTDPEADKVAPYTFNCESKFKTKLPYSVTIYADPDASFQVPVNHFTHNVSKSSLNICILPEPTPQDSTIKLRESLIFHRLVEADGVRLYSGGISTSLLETVSKMRGEMDVSVAPWNVPVQLSAEVVADLVTRDCYYQSRGSYQLYTVLSSTQVIMPLQGKRSLRDSLLAMRQGAVLSTGPNTVQVKRFCSEYPSDKKSKNFPISISILESTLYNKQLSEGASISLHYLGDVAGEASEKVEEFVSVNEYSDCDRYDFSESDKTAGYQADALRFSKDLINLFIRFT